MTSKSGLAAKNAAQPAARQRVVVGYHQRDHAAASPTGIEAG
jgi:hypothetical protein